MKFRTQASPIPRSAVGKRARWQLTVEYLGSLILLIGIGAVLVWELQQQKHSILAASQQAQTTLAHIAEAELVSMIRSSDQVLAELSYLHGNDRLVRQAKEPDFWQEIWRALPESSFQFATDAKGKIVAASQSNLLGLQVDKCDYFTLPHAFQDSFRVFISSPEHILGEEIAIVLSRPVLSVNNEWRGVVAVVLPSTKFTRVLEHFRINTTQTATLTDESGAIIARVPMPMGYGQMPVLSANHSMFANHQRSGSTVTFGDFVSEVDGQEKIGTALTVNTNPIQTNQSLTVVVSEFAEVVLAPWRRMQSVLWGYFLMALIAVWFGVISYRRRRDNEGARALIDALLANPALAVVGVRENGAIALFSPAAVAMIGYSEHEALGRNWFELCVLPHERSRLKEYFKQMESSPTTQSEYENTILTRAGDARVVAWQISMIRDNKGWMAVGLGTDITQHRQRETELETLAHIDALTGIANRRHFLELATKALSQARRHAHCLSVLLLDIDHFKLVNDTHGHHVGDLVLQDFARKCSEMLREEDLLGRLGGEEFGVVLPETDGDAAVIAAERIRQHFADSSTVLDSGGSIQCTVSIGVTTLGSRDVTCEELLQQADHALYAAKHGGRDRVVLEAIK